MRKISLLLCLALVVSLFGAFASVNAAESALTYKEDAAIAAQVKSFTDLKAMFNENPDLALIQKTYQEQLQTQVKAIDATLKATDPKIDDTISAVLKLAVEGKLNAGQAKQALDKGLQWYFYFLIKDQVNGKARTALTNGDLATAQVELEKAVQIYVTTLQATVGKRDTKFKTQMQNVLDNVAFPSLKQDIEKKDLASYNVHRQMLDKTLIKMFSLAALTYAEVTPTKPVADQPAAMTEGYFFYMAVYTYLKGGSAADADYILNAFGSGDVSKLDLTKVSAAMQRAMIGKVAEYLKKSSDYLEKGDVAGARVYAMEGVMFLAAQETFLGEGYAAAAELATAYNTAVEKADKKLADKLAFDIMKILVKTDGLSLKLNEKKLTKNGVEKDVLTAAYINKKTNRTLAPVRLIAEALDCKVSFDNKTKTVTIVKGDDTFQLVAGSDVVLKNGTALESKLDQPVVIEKGATFIPLRAVAELFAQKVFYNQGEVLVSR